MQPLHSFIVHSRVLNNARNLGAVMDENSAVIIDLNPDADMKSVTVDLMDDSQDDAWQALWTRLFVHH